MSCLLKVITIPTKKAANRTKNMMSVQDLSSIGPSSSSSSSSGAVLLPPQHSMCCYSEVLCNVIVDLGPTDTDINIYTITPASPYYKYIKEKIYNY